MINISNINFKKDLYKELKNRIKEYGYTCPTKQQLRENDQRKEEIKSKIKDYDLQNLLQHFFTVTSRRIPVLKRSVLISNELNKKTSLDKDLKQNIEKIKSLFVQGDDLNPYLSRKISEIDQTGKNGKNSDKLLYEWGIHHLHFDVNRTKELLFVMVFSDAALFIDVLEHENSVDKNITWTNTDLIQIIHDNWPQAISDSIFAKGKEESLTSQERKTLRYKSANTTVVVKDGTEYLPPGFGFTSSSHPILAIRDSDFLLSQVEELESALVENFDKITALFNENKPTEFHFVLKLDDEIKPYIFELNSKTQLNLDIQYKSQNEQ